MGSQGFKTTCRHVVFARRVERIEFKFSVITVMNHKYLLDGQRPRSAFRRWVPE
jgi:hypothetical protein